MTKGDLIDLLSEILSPHGFKRKGNYWVDNRGEISKIVNLQKSQFSDSYYINYGYVIKELPLDNAKMHIYLRLSSGGAGHNEVSELLKLENDIPDHVRRARLLEIVNEKLIPALSAINQESDIREKIVDGTWKKIIPLTVKRHFGLASTLSQIAQIT